MDPSFLQSGYIVIEATDTDTSLSYNTEKLLVKQFNIPADATNDFIRTVLEEQLLLLMEPHPEVYQQR